MEEPSVVAGRMEKLMAMGCAQVPRDRVNTQDLGITVLRFLESTPGQGKIYKNMFDESVTVDLSQVCSSALSVAESENISISNNILMTSVSQLQQKIPVTRVT